MKRRVLFPFLFIFDVVLTPLAGNLDQIDPSLALRPLLVLLLGVGVVWALIYLLTKEWGYAGYLVFLFSVFLCGSAYLSRFIQEHLIPSGMSLVDSIFMVIIAVVLSILAIKGVWTRLGGRGDLVTYLNLVFVLGLLFPVFDLLSSYVFQPLQASSAAENAQVSFGETQLTCGNAPDIYYLILDGYGRADALQELYGLDNQPFLEYLAGKGFYVATESYTNYIQTIYSVPAGLNFNYIAPPAEGANSQVYFADLMEHNGIMSALKRCGYRTVAFESGFYFTNQPDVDVYFKYGIGANEFESLLLADSPVEVLADELNLTVSDQSYEAHRLRVSYAFDKLATLSKMDSPKFVFAHIVSPHPPFVFDAAGQPHDPDRRYYIGDGDDYQGNLEEYMAGYAGQVAFVNSRLEQVIDSILANSATLPVIILQGDHGPGSRLVWDSPSQTCLWERTPILNAYYLPGAGNSWLYPSISPVNSFRVVLNAYFDADLELLPDQTYFSSHTLERQVIDITVERTSRENCAAPGVK